MSSANCWKGELFGHLCANLARLGWHLHTYSQCVKSAVRTFTYLVVAWWVCTSIQSAIHTLMYLHVMYYDSWPTSATVRCKITHNVLCVLCFLIEHSRFVMVERQDCTRILSLVTICKLSIDVDLPKWSPSAQPIWWVIYQIFSILRWSSVGNFKKEKGLEICW